MKASIIKNSTGTSIALSSLASALGLCCFTPWVVPLLGVSGAILFARLGAYRPYFLGLATILMAAAIVGAYRSRHSCAADPALRRRRAWLNIFLGIGVLALAIAALSGQIEVLLEHSLQP